MKTIGLIGGMSWESSAHYYQICNRETAARLGGLHSAPMLIDSVDFAPIEAMQRAGQWHEAGELLAGSARRLQDAGADLMALSSNTMHIVADQIRDAISVPFVHIADPTAEALLADGFTRAGLLGTRFTMEMDFYHQAMKARGVETFPPGVGHTDLNAIIYEQLCRGVVTEASRATYVAAIERLAGMGAEAVILGCTEIAMLIDDAVSPLPVFDTSELHARALVASALT
jgi:aspartate racemase